MTPKTRDEILAALHERHRDLLREGERFDLEAAQAGKTLTASLALSGGPEGTRVEMEVRVDFERARVDGEGGLGLALDALDLSMGEYLEAGRSERLPSGFEERDLDGRPVLFRGRVRRPDLEAEADRLLRRSSSEGE